MLSFSAFHTPTLQLCSVFLQGKIPTTTTTTTSTYLSTYLAPNYYSAVALYPPEKHNNLELVTLAVIDSTTQAPTTLSSDACSPPEREPEKFLRAAFVFRDTAIGVTATTALASEVPMSRRQRGGGE